MKLGQLQLLIPHCGRNLLRMQVRDVIREARLKLGMSQKGLADLSGVSEKQIQNIEAGANTSVEFLAKLAPVLGLHTIPVTQSLNVEVTPAPLNLGAAFDVISPEPRNIRLQVKATVAAGHGGWSDESDGEWFEVSEVLVREGDFLVKVVGESMIDEGLYDGDYLIVRRVPPNIAPHGKIVIAWLNDGLVVKYWVRRGGRKYLKSRNPAYPEREITPDDIFEIQAVVQWIMQNPKNRSAELSREARQSNPKISG